MAILKNLIFRRYNTLINPKTLQNHPTTPHSLYFKSSISSSPQPQIEQNKKPLSTLFTEVMSGKITTIDIEEGNEGEDTELKKELKQLAQEVSSFIENSKNAPKKKSLYAAFTNKSDNNSDKKTKHVEEKGEKKKSLYGVFSNKSENSVAKEKVENLRKPKHVEEESEKKSLYDVFSNKSENSVGKKKVENLRKPLEVKELSPDMEMFVKFLYEKGYFNDANFTKGWERFDAALFETVFARQYIKFAARIFGKDNQEISKWLSVSALKQVAVFGCPSNDRGIVFPTKVLRKFFEIPENTVCSKCVLRESCKFMNKSVWGHPNILDLENVMKVITTYALQWVHPELVVSEEVNKAISQLLKEFVKLSQTT